MEISGIYKIESNVKPNRIYIGSAADIYDRWRHHKSDLILKKHSNRKLQNHSNKYGIGDLNFSILLSSDINDLINNEQFFIDLYNPWFNINPIAKSRAGSKCSEETKQKMRDRMRGNKIHSGHKHSMEVRKKMGLHKIGHIPWNKGGAYYSDETLQKMSDAKKGKLSNNKNKKNKPWTEERKRIYITKRIGMKYNKQYKQEVA